MKAFDGVLTERSGDLMIVTLNRPETGNELTREMSVALGAALERAGEDDEVYGLLLLARGAVFSGRRDGPGDAASHEAGLQDAGDRHFALEDDVFALRTVRIAKTMHKPVVCAVNGPAVGIGARLALACSTVIASRHASFVQSIARLDMRATKGGSWMLTSDLGGQADRTRARHMTQIDAETAASWNLILRTVAPDELEPEALALARELAAARKRGIARRAQQREGARNVRFWQNVGPGSFTSWGQLSDQGSLLDLVLGLPAGSRPN